MIKPIEWLGQSVRFIDQTKLPSEVFLQETPDFRDLVAAIRTLQLRGAPLIGIAAAYGVALAAARSASQNLTAFRTEVLSAIKEFASSRPTAVNLFWALHRMQNVLETSATVDAARKSLLDEALAIHRDDQEKCRRIGRHGARLFPEKTAVLTHCNTGSLATGGIGTALGAILTARDEGKNVTVYVDETRPLLQGARLTMWELKGAGVDATLITDSTAAFLMKEKKIGLVIVGADRIAANGDVANKIGTYQLALSARAHDIPFYVAAPTSTIDTSIGCGEKIPIEERNPDEITRGFGSRTAPEGIKVYSPAFDITPGTLVSAIITEEGVSHFPYDFKQ